VIENWYRFGGKRKMYSELGTTICSLREGKNETQQQLADALGVSRSYVKSWENGERPIRSDDLYNLAVHYNVSADYLLGLSPAAPRDPELQEVAKYTGLSEKALQIVCNYKEDYNLDDGRTGPSNWLSEVLCCNNLKQIISLLTQLRDIRIFVDIFLDMLEKIKDGAIVDDDDVRSFCETWLHEIPAANDLHKKVENLFLRWYGELKLIRFELSEVFSDLLEEYEPTKALIELGNKYYYSHSFNNEEGGQ
jgi:transcriptional regulator with XRE-family HTH domain